MATTEKLLTQLVINQVESKEVYKWMEDNNLINDDEIYLIDGEDVTVTPELTSGTKIGSITVGDQTIDLYAPATDNLQEQLNNKPDLNGYENRFTGTNMFFGITGFSNDVTFNNKNSNSPSTVEFDVNNVYLYSNSQHGYKVSLAPYPVTNHELFLEIDEDLTNEIWKIGFSKNIYLNNILNPIENTDAANKQYVDSSISTGNAASAATVYTSANTEKAYVLGTISNTDGNNSVVYNTSVYTKGSVLKGAAWNDYAEYRQSNILEAGRVVCENGDDTLSLATERLQPGAEIVSDTFGFAIGETEKCKTPIAVSGRVLAYPYENRDFYKPGDAVCAAPGGTVSKMTREEIREYPERIVGTVSAIPEYETWGEGNVPVNGRIWIKVK